ncbi:hypothetical protein Zmor_027749 [Zophobas morio]|uniref:Uncharacterized protein n=1 Tax=Zophobas morio TaxID=2755281 RepID=A0AA38HU01_9CUCU|nr:hypothetical protein Zmor_027749 [Zophobas morio]
MSQNSETDNFTIIFVCLFEKYYVVEAGASPPPAPAAVAPAFKSPVTHIPPLHLPKASGRRVQVSLRSGRLSEFFLGSIATGLWPVWLWTRLSQ